MSDEHGFSFPESMLSLLIVYLIFTSLFPVADQMMKGLEDQRLAAQAASVASDAIDGHYLYGAVEGTRELDGKAFDWRMQGGGICVSYKASAGWKSRCFEPGY